ncbi:unnamed protein product, partial [Ixodes pacificus]
MTSCCGWASTTSRASGSSCRTWSGGSRSWPRTRASTPAPSSTTWPCSASTRPSHSRTTCCPSACRTQTTPTFSSHALDGPLPSVMQKVSVPIITNKECETMYRKAGFIEDIPNIFICAGLAKGGKDSCE